MLVWYCELTLSDFIQFVEFIPLFGWKFIHFENTQAKRLHAELLQNIEQLHYVRGLQNKVRFQANNQRHILLSLSSIVNEH